MLQYLIQFARGLELNKSNKSSVNNSCWYIKYDLILVSCKTALNWMWTVLGYSQLKSPVQQCYHFTKKVKCTKKKRWYNYTVTVFTGVLTMIVTPLQLSGSGFNGKSSSIAGRITVSEMWLKWPVYGTEWIVLPAVTCYVQNKVQMAISFQVY